MERINEQVNVRRQRDRFGGTNWGAAFFGWLVAIGVGALLTGLLSAIGSAVSLSTGAIDDLAQAPTTVGLISGALLLLAIGVAYYAGGYVAGRMSRFDGGRQGVGVWVMGAIMTILLAALAVLFGSSYNLLQQLNIPTIPTNSGQLTGAGLITLLLVTGVSLLAAIGGGMAGTRYHRAVDRAGREPLAATTPQDSDEPSRTYTRAGRAMPSFGERIENRSSSQPDRSRRRF